MKSKKICMYTLAVTCITVTPIICTSCKDNNKDIKINFRDITRNDDLSNFWLIVPRKNIGARDTSVNVHPFVSRDEHPFNQNDSYQISCFPWDMAGIWMYFQITNDEIDSGVSIGFYENGDMDVSNSWQTDSTNYSTQLLGDWNLKYFAIVNVQQNTESNVFDSWLNDCYFTNIRPTYE